MFSVKKIAPMLGLLFLFFFAGQAVAQLNDPFWDQFFNAEQYSEERIEQCSPPPTQAITGGFRQYTGWCKNTYVNGELYSQRFEYRFCKWKGKRKGGTLRFSSDKIHCERKQYTRPHYLGNRYYRDSREYDDWPNDRHHQRRGDRFDRNNGQNDHHYP